MRLQSYLVLMILAASRAFAQVDAPSRPVDVWLAASLGGAGIRDVDESLLAVRASAWTSVGHAVFGVRAAGVGPLYSDGGTDVADLALLGGLRATSPPDGSLLRGAAQFTIGPAITHGHARSGGQAQRKVGPDPALAFDADATFHVRVLGLGVSVFGALSPHNTYSALGFTLSLGKID